MCGETFSKQTEVMFCVSVVRYIKERTLASRATKSFFVSRSQKNCLVAELLLTLISTATLRLESMRKRNSLRRYSIFEDSYRLQHCHCLGNVGVGRMLKKCVVVMLGDKEKATSALRSSNGNERPFRSIKTTVLSTLSLFLKFCADSSPGYGL